MLIGGLAMLTTMPTDIMGNRCYGPHLVNHGPLFSIAIKNLSAYYFCTSAVALDIVVYLG